MGRNLLTSKINDLEDDGKQQGYYAGLPLATQEPRRQTLVRGREGRPDRFASPSHAATGKTIHDWLDWHLKDAIFRSDPKPLPTKDGLFDDENPVADRLHRMPVLDQSRGRDRGRFRG
jgi:hypothetical protein